MNDAWGKLPTVLDDPETRDRLIAIEATEKVLDYAATHACMRPNRDGSKREDCVCAPCCARRLRFGANIPVQVQEPLRVELEAARLEASAAIILRTQRDEAWVREAKLQDEIPKRASTALLWIMKASRDDRVMFAADVAVYGTWGLIAASTPAYVKVKLREIFGEEPRLAPSVGDYAAALGVPIEFLGGGETSGAAEATKARHGLGWAKAGEDEA